MVSGETITSPCRPVYFRLLFLGVGREMSFDKENDWERKIGLARPAPLLLRGGKDLLSLWADSQVALGQRVSVDPATFKVQLDLPINHSFPVAL